MKNPVDFAKNQLTEIVSAAYKKASDGGALPPGAEVTITAEIPRDAQNGDYATSFALAAAKQLKRSPRDVATALCENINLENSLFSSVEIAGPGFINFRLSDKWYSDVLLSISENAENYGRTDDGAGRTVQVEFVSANPTGPMTIGNARGGVLGDSLAAVLDFAGWKVTREFYLNDAGNQVELFGCSIDARYRQLILGEDKVEFPDDGYHGDDIRELAAAFRAEFGDEIANLPDEERREKMVTFGLSSNVARMKRDLERYGINYDVWFPESDLHNSGYVKETMDMLIERGVTYEKEGAIWLKSTDFGLEKDEVLIRSNGFYTYYAVDIAYHRNKFEKRGFDKVIDCLGADHHGHTIRFRAGLDALGIDSTKLDFLLFQFVRLYKDGELFKVSKRSGRAISLADLLDEVPLDATRFLFNMQTAGSVIEFDMDLAIKESSDNPIYYVQYAHARICSLLSALASEGDEIPNISEVDFSLLTDSSERELIKILGAFPEQIRACARDYEPSGINRYLMEIAGAFHRFYAACRIRGEADALKKARLLLVSSTKTVLGTGLKLLGVGAPERM